MWGRPEKARGEREKQKVQKVVYFIAIWGRELQQMKNSFSSLLLAIYRGCASSDFVRRFDCNGVDRGSCVRITDSLSQGLCDFMATGPK